MTKLRNALFTACKMGCLDSVHMCLEKLHTEHTQSGASCFKNADEDSATIPQHSHNSAVTGSSVESSDICDVSKIANCVQQTVVSSSLTPEYSANMAPDLSAITDSCVEEPSISKSSIGVCNALDIDNHIQQTVDSSSSGTENPTKITSGSSAGVHFLNLPLSDDGTTFLHVAAQEGHPDMVTELLSSGADPAVK